MADAKATEIYARAYNQSPESVAFYEFTRTMQSYKSIIAENTTLVLSTDSDLFKFLKGMTPDGDVIPDSSQEPDCFIAERHTPAHPAGTSVVFVASSILLCNGNVLSADLSSAGRESPLVMFTPPNATG